VVVAYDKGVEFDRVEFTVGTLGEEFIQGVEQRTVIEDFPSPDEYTVMEWNESTQHFEVLSVLGGEQRETEVQYDSTFWTNLEDLIAKFSHVYHAKYDPTFWTNLEDLIETWKEELSCEEGTECGSMADR